MSVSQRKTDDPFLWVFCKQCKAVHKTTASNRERRISCRTCGAEMHVSAITRSTPPTSETPPELVARNALASDKIFWTDCPFCQKRYKLNAVMNDDYVRCCECDTIMYAKRVLPSHGKDTATATALEPVCTPGKASAKSANHAPTCSYCGADVLADESKTVCEACGLIFHAECWKENMGCTAYGCRMQNCLKAGPDLRIAEEMLALQPSSPRQTQTTFVSPPAGQNCHYMVARGGQQKGPYRSGEITKMVAAGKLSGNDLCWTEGMPNWCPLSEVIPYCAASASSFPGQMPSFAGRTYSMGILTLVFWSITNLLFLAYAQSASANKDLYFPSDTKVALFFGFFLALIFATIFISILHHRCWKQLPSQSQWTTPGKAVGYMFIPFYNLYWAFTSWRKLAEGINRELERRGQPKETHIEGLALGLAITFASCSILTIPFFVFGILFYRNARNALIALDRAE